MKSSITISILLTFSVAAAASDDGFGGPLDRCRDMSNYGAAGACAKEVAESADIELNTAYGSLISQLKRPDAKRLRIAQRKWIEFKEADCEFSSPLINGSDVKESSDRYYCVAEKTISRLNEIKEILSWPVGCNGCPF